MKRGRLGEAFATRSRLMRVFLTRFGSNVEPDDVVQSTFERVCRRDLDQIEELDAYLHRTSRNLAINEVRRAERGLIKSVDPRELDELGGAATDLSPEDAVISNERFAQMMLILKSLPMLERQSLLMARFHGLSHQEIGARLGVSHRNIARYLARASAKCDAALKALDQSEP